jgi:Flp pilus assembly protein TadD
LALLAAWRFIKVLKLPPSPHCQITPLWHLEAMKSFVTGCLLFASLLLAQAQQDPDSKYIGIYELIEQGQKLMTTGQPKEAAARLTEAQTQLLQFQKIYPDWNPGIVNFRLHKLSTQLADLPAPPPASQAATQPLPDQTVVLKPAVIPAPVPPVEPVPATKEPSEVDRLNDQLQFAQSENAALQAKLKEALSARPALMDTNELAKMQEQIRWLMKENDLLKSSQLTAQTQSAADTNSLKQAKKELAETTKKYQAEQDRAAKLAADNEQIQQTIAQRGAELLQARKNLDDYVKKYSTEQNRASQLTHENEELRVQIGATTVDTNALAALRDQNTRLQAQLAALQTAATNAPNARLADDLKQARAQIIQLQAAAAESAKAQAELQQQLRAISEERDGLLRKLDDANRKLAKRKAASADEEIAALHRELDTLRARLAISEAKAEPFTDEELALLAQPAPSGAPKTSQKSVHEMPAGTKELVASAQNHFAHHEYQQAETDYQQILIRDQTNIIALGNLATIELQQNKYDDAEKHLQAALKQSPKDAYTLSTLGYLKYRQEKYDEALNFLSQAAAQDGSNPEILNYLGVTYSHTGRRNQAESALRKAIAQAPNYAPAHNNLAVIYLTADPASPRLARLHYQKALAAGQPRNPDFEKALADKGVPVDNP